MPIIEEINDPNWKGGYVGELNLSVLHHGTTEAQRDYEGSYGEIAQNGFDGLQVRYPDLTRRTAVFEGNMDALERHLGEGHPKIKRIREEFYKRFHAPA